MYLPLLIARRLHLRERGERGTATGMTVGICGVALAFVIMLLAIAIVTGFKHEIVAKVAGINSDIVLYNPEGAIELTPELQEVITSALPDAHVDVVVQLTGILKTPEQFQGLTFTGIAAPYDTTFLASVTEAGTVAPVLDADGRAMAISRATAEALDLDLGDKVDAYFVMDEQIRPRRYQVCAIFNTHFGAYDRLTAIAPRGSLPGVGGAEAGTAVEINGIPSGEVGGAADSLYGALLAAYSSGHIGEMPMMTDIRRTGELYFNWLSLLDTNVVVILILMGVVAGFTLVSSLFVIILRKVRLIGVLKALGATDTMIGNTFIIVALRIVGWGLLLGNIIGLTLLWIQATWHPLRLAPENYYLDYVPVVLDPIALLALNAGVAVMALLVIVAPSRLVVTVSPASTMRYE